jgi:hypothetical protein
MHARGVTSSALFHPVMPGVDRNMRSPFVFTHASMAVKADQPTMKECQ